MTTIHIKTPYPEQAIPLVKEAIELEKKLVRGSLATTNERIAALAQELRVDEHAVLAGTVPRTEANEMALLELEGELAIRTSLEDALRSLDSLELCS